MRIFSAVIVLLFLGSCMSSPYYQKTYNLPQNAWRYDYTPDFKIDISDTGVYYQMYFVIRHTVAYPYSNIWMNIYTKQPGDSNFVKTRIEVPLSVPSGQWLGRGMGEIYEQRMPITEQGDRSIFAKAGKYELRLEQDMRINPLPEILQLGIRVEKGMKKMSPKKNN